MATLTEPASGETSGALFRALRSAGVEPDLAYRADDEIRSQAGQNVITVVDARFTVVNARFDELSAKIDSQATEIRSNRWMMGAVLALLATLTALGVFNTALGLVD